jgi:hypothetical protein
MKETEETCLHMFTNASLSSILQEGFDESVSEVVERGVDVRTILSVDRKHIAESLKGMGRIRYFSEPSASLAIYDQEQVILGASTSGPAVAPQEEMSIYTDSSAIVKILSDLFETTWEAAAE